MKKITIIGLGYIGLPTALAAANNNFIVSGFDIDQKKVDSINKKISPISEPGIQELLQEAIEKNHFYAYTTLQPADCFIITVPTPFQEDKTPDLRSVFDACKNISIKLKPGNLIILESTVPVGTTEKLCTFIEKHSGLKSKKDFFMAYCPERVLPGKIVSELVSNDRIIGGICATSTNMANTFYKQFVKGKCFATNSKTAEMIKLVENSYRDVQIAFANQVAGMCDEAKINPFDVISFANKHPRVNILQPGCGVGGHCIAVDPWFLIKGFSQNTNLLLQARKINDNKPKEVIQTVLDKAKEFITKNNKPPRVLTLGLTFKPDVDDIRQSPALYIVKKLQKCSFITLFVHDPYVTDDTFENIKNLDQAIHISDIVVILVKHSRFEKALTKYELLDNKIIIDPCGLIQQRELKKNFHYEADIFKKRQSKIL
jgi:UDP-N-acetyl-D-mannosaminuronic acid dehydrogenase